MKTRTYVSLIIAISFFSNLYAQPWTQLGGDIDGEAAFDNSGMALCMSDDGNTIVIGAPGNDGSYNGAGHARVYELIGSSWIQKGMDIDGEGMYDGSGIAVSINADGSIIAIGATSNSDGGSGSGHIRVYEWITSAWVQKGLDIDGESTYEEFGNALSMNATGDIIIIGASKNDDVSSNSGQVRIFEWDGLAWIQKGIDINGDAANDAFGTSVGMSNDGNVIAVGAPMNSGTFVNAGHVKIYQWNTTDWLQKGNDIGGEVAYDRSGFSVSLSSDGNIVAIGAIMNNGNGVDAGHVRIYEWNSTTWVQKGADIDGEAYDDNSGWSVSLSADGNTVAIGAKGNDGTTGVNAVQGQVRVYEWISNTWLQRGDDIDGEADPDFFGTAVDISADGSIISSGGPGNVGNGTSSGSVRVFETPDFTSIVETDFNDFSVFPNPTIDKVHINLGSVYQNVRVEVKNSIGQLIVKYNYTNLQIASIPISGSKGIYFIEIIADKNHLSRTKLTKL